VYTLTVESGTGGGSFASGASATITANAAPAGKQFDKWVLSSGSGTFANANNTSTTFTMGSANATVTATYIDQTYTLTVSGGTGGGGFVPGAAVTITANAAAAGKKFDKWVLSSGSGTIANVNGASTTFTMGSANATVTATYIDETYALTVSGGTGGGNYTLGAVANISATVPSGMAFDKWVLDSGTGTIGNANNASTTFTMSSSAATVRATFTIKTSSGLELTVPAELTGLYTLANGLFEGFALLTTASQIKTLFKDAVVVKNDKGVVVSDSTPMCTG